MRRRMTTLKTCFLAVYKPQPNQQVLELPATMRALPRPIASTLTHLFMTQLSTTLGSFRHLREFDVDRLSSLKMISFDMVFFVRLNLSKEDVNDAAKLLECTLRKVGAVGGQEWLPRGLPKVGVQYNGHVQVLNDCTVYDRAVLATTSPSFPGKVLVLRSTPPLVIAAS